MHGFWSKITSGRITLDQGPTICSGKLYTLKTKQNKTKQNNTFVLLGLDGHEQVPIRHNKDIRLRRSIYNPLYAGRGLSRIKN